MKKMKLIYSMVLLVLILVSCGDTGSNSCTTYGAESPQNKAELKATLVKFYVECQNEADYSLIDVSGVTDMSELFKGNTNFNGDISSWNMSGVENVTSMFEGATAFDQDLSGWALKAGVIAKGSSSPTKMFYKSGMRPKRLPTINFYQYTPDNADLKAAVNAEIATFAQGPTADLSIIDTSQVTDMGSLFKDNTTFNGYIATWDTSKVTTMYYMFGGALAFNQPIGDWDTSKLMYMLNMFVNASAFNQPIGDWDTSMITTMEGMFSGASVFNQPIGKWRTGNVITMEEMFQSALAFNQPIKDWNTSKVQFFNSTFKSAVAFNQDLTRWSNDAGPITTAMFDNSGMSEDNKAPWMPK